MFGKIYSYINGFKLCISSIPTPLWGIIEQGHFINFGKN